MVKVEEYHIRASHFTAEDFIGSLIPSTSKFAMELFLGKGKMILTCCLWYEFC